MANLGITSLPFLITIIIAIAFLVVILEISGAQEVD